MIKIFKSFIILPLFFACVGCNYKSGLTSELKPCSLGIKIKNNSKAIQFSSVFRRIFKDELLKYPDLSLVDPASSNQDYVISVVLESYGMKPESFQAGDTISAASFQGNLSAHIIVTNSRHNREFLNSNYCPFIIIFTKSDKLKVIDLDKRLETLKRQLSDYWEDFPKMIITSSKNKKGIDEIHSFIESSLKDYII